MALGHDPGERRGHDRVGQALPPELDGGLPLADQRLGGLDRAQIRLELGLGAPQLVGVLAERGLGHLDERLRGLGLGARLVDVARRDQVLGQELLVPLELAPLPLRVGARPLDVGRERAAALPHALEVGAARVRRRVAPARGSRAAPARSAASWSIARSASRRSRSASGCPSRTASPEVDVEPDDRARELRAGDGLLPGEETPDRVDAALDGAALDGARW